MRHGLYRDKTRPKSSGLQLPSRPEVGAEPLAVAMHYLDHYVADYGRARFVVKARAKRVVMWTAIANGCIAVLGTATALFNATWLGLVSTALAGLVATLAAWEGLFRHQEMWAQRSIILGQLVALQRMVDLDRADTVDSKVLAHSTMRRLNEILEGDLDNWTALRQTQTGLSERDGRSS